MNIGNILDGTQAPAGQPTSSAPTGNTQITSSQTTRTTIGAILDPSYHPDEDTVKDGVFSFSGKNIFVRILTFFIAIQLLFALGSLIVGGFGSYLFKKEYKQSTYPATYTAPKIVTPAPLLVQNNINTGTSTAGVDQTTSSSSSKAEVQVQRKSDPLPLVPVPGPKSNAMSCAKPKVSNLEAGKVACYGIWDYGDEFGNDQDMCGDSSNKTGCKLKTPACLSGVAQATTALRPKGMTLQELEPYAIKLNTSSQAVKTQILTLWEYTCITQ